MKLEKIKITILVLLFSNSIASQITKGNWLVGGTCNVSSTTYKNETIEQKINSFVVSPNLGHFIVDKLVVGINLNYTSNYFKHSEVRLTSYKIGPLIRYYFLNQDHILNYFSQISYGYEEGKSNNRDSRYHNNIFGIRAGSTIFFNSSVALELALDYNFGKNNSIAHVNLIQFGLGFQIHLEK